MFTSEHDYKSMRFSSDDDELSEDDNFSLSFHKNLPEVNKVTKKLELD